MAFLRARCKRPCGSSSPQQNNWYSVSLHGHLDAEALQPQVGSDSSQQRVLLENLCENGEAEAACEALSGIQFPLPTSTYLALLKTSINSKCLALAVQTRLHLAVNTVPITGFLGDYLVMTLAKCGAVDDARTLSSSLPNLTVYSCTAMIIAYTELDRDEDALQAYQDMLKSGIDPDSFTFVSLFKTCGSMPNISQGKVLHVHAHNRGLATHTFVGNTIVSMYGKCGGLSDAEAVFAELNDRDTVSWNGMLSAYIEQGQAKKTLVLYRQIHAEGVAVNLATFVIVLQACTILAEDEDASHLSKSVLYDIGKALHADACKRCFDSHFLVGTVILSMYAHCGSLVEAECIFSALSTRDIIAWNAMLTAYVEQKQADKALCLFLQMQREGTSPDLLTYLSAVQACGVLSEETEKSLDSRIGTSRCLEMGFLFHMELCTKGYTDHAPVANVLLSMYGRCGALAEAEGLFSGIIERDIISWNAMLCAHCERGQVEKALSLFEVMQTHQVFASDVTFICVLQACGARGDRELTRSVNFAILSAGFDNVLSLTSTLLNAYGSLASIADAEVVFNSFPEPTAVAWNACIAGHSGSKAVLGSLYMFEDMTLCGLTPDEATYTSLLSACSHNGLVVECVRYLSGDTRGFTEEGKYLNIFVDLFGRAGDFKRLMSYFQKFETQADVISWSNLLGACSSHGNFALAKRAFDEVVQMEGTESSVYVLMSNLYADTQL